MLHGCAEALPNEKIVFSTISTIEVDAIDKVTSDDLIDLGEESMIDDVKVLNCILNTPATIEEDVFSECCTQLSILRNTNQCFEYFFSEFIAKSLMAQKNNIVGWNKDFISRFACKFEKEFNGIGNISSPHFKKAIQHILCGSYKQQTTLGESAINVQLYMKYFKLNKPFNDYQMNQLIDTMQKSADWSHLKLIELQTVDVLTALDVSMDRTFHFGFKNSVNIHHDEVLMSLLDAQPICM